MYECINRAEEIAFTSLPSIGDVKEQRVGVFGDLGDTANSSVTLQHLIDNAVDIVLNVGDLVRALNVRSHYALWIFIGDPLQRGQLCVLWVATGVRLVLLMAVTG